MWFVSRSKYKAMEKQLMGMVESLKSRLEDEERNNEHYLKLVREDAEKVRSERNQLESNLRNCFWELARAEAVIETSTHSHMGKTSYTYRVSFRPQLRRLGGGTWGLDYRGCNQVEVDFEKAILDALITTIGVKGWEYKDGVLRRAYSQVEELLNAPSHTKETTDFLQGHLDQALRERQYLDILNAAGDTEVEATKADNVT